MKKSGTNPGHRIFPVGLAGHLLTTMFSLFLAVLVFSGQAAASGGTPLDSYPYRHPVMYQQIATAIAVDPAGYIIIVGSTQNATQDFMVVKIKADGSDKVWEATFDLANGDDQAVAVAVGSNGNVFVTGAVDNGINTDIHTVKYFRDTGSVIWENTYNGPKNGNDRPYALAMDYLNNVYIAGKTQGASGDDDGLLIKYNSNGANPDGSPIFEVFFDGAVGGGNDEFDAVGTGPAGVDGVVVTGKTNNGTDFDYVSMKYNFDGTKVCAAEKIYDSGLTDQGKYAAMDDSGNMIVTGKIGVNAGDIRTIKYDGNDCSQSWSRNYSATAGPSYPDEPQGIWIDSNDVYITGNTYSALGYTDFYTARYSGSDGSPVWEKVFSSAAVGNTDIPAGIVVDHDGDVFVTGYSHKTATDDDDFTTLKYKKDDGTALWDFGSGAGAFDGTKNADDQAVGLGLDSTGKLYVGGWSDATDTYTPVVSDYDFLVIKYDPGNLNPPSSLTATTVSNTGIDLTWADNSNNETGFKIYRALSATLDYTEVDTVGADVTSYSDTGLTAHVWYSYKVKAYIDSPASESHYSSPATALTTLISYTAPSWVYTYTSSDAGEDVAYAIAAGPDQHPVATGTTQTAANGVLTSYDYYTVKIDRDTAAKIWQASYNDTYDDTDTADAVAVDSNNDVIVAGYSFLSWLGNEPTLDIYTRKYPAAGPGTRPPDFYPYDWAGQYNGPDGDVDRSEAIDAGIDSDNNVVVTGYGKNLALNQDIYIVKYDTANGDKLWDYTPYDGGGDDYPVAVAYDGNGDVIITGKTYLGGNYDIFTRKHRGSDGAVLWTAIYDAGFGWDEARGMDIDSNGDVYVAGAVINGSGNDDWIIIKYDGDTETATGTILWFTTVDGPAGGDDVPESIKVDPNDDALVVAGTVLKSAGNNDFHVRRYTAAGALDWENTLDRPGNDDNATTMAMDISGNVCVAGNTDDGSHIDLLAVKFDSAGNILGGTLHNAPDDSNAYGMTANRSGDFFAAGYTTPVNNGDPDFLVLKCEGYVLQSPSPFTPTIHYSAVDFSWAVDNTTDEDGFYVERKSGTCDSENSWVRIHTAPAGASGLTSYTDEGLNIGGTYCYRIQTYKDNGSTSRWIEKEITTSTAPPPAGLSAVVLNTTDIKLQWTDTTSSESGFTIQRCIGAGCTDFTSVTAVELDVPANTESFIDTTACYNQTYNYRIQAYKTGAWATSFTNSTDTDLHTDSLADPTVLTLDGLAQDTLALSWNDNSNDETSYTVERCPNAAGSCTADEDFTYSATTTTIYGNVLLYGMDAITADEITDSSGNGNTGTAFGSPTVAADGKYYSRVRLDGTNDYITSSLAVSQAGPATANAGATMMAWVYPDSTSANYHYLFSTENGSAGSENFNWGVSRNGADWYVDTGEAQRPAGATVTADQWQHIAVVFDPAAGNVKFYKNGVETTVAFIGYNDTAQGFTIGRRGAMNQEFFDGSLDEVAVYDRSLTEAQVQALMNDSVFEAGKAKFGDDTITYTNTYTYRVKAVKDTDPSCTWNPNPTNSLEVTADPPPPTNLVTATLDSTTVKLTWDDNTLGENNFTLQRCEGDGCNSGFTTVSAAIPADSVLYYDTTACGNTIYNYQIKATDDVWTDTAYSTRSQTVTSAQGITPASFTITDIWEEQANLQWDYSANDLTGFKVGACPISLTPCSNPGDYSETTIQYIPDGALMWLKFDDSDWSQGALYDSTGNGYTATVRNNVPQVTGYLGSGAGNFNGSNHYIDTSLNINQDNSSAPGITFEAWVYPTLYNSTYKYVFSTENTASGWDWGIAQYYDTWYVTYGTSRRSMANLTRNVWQHIAATYTPGVGIKLYLNGVEYIYNAIGYDTSDANITIGREGSLNQGYFGGKIDEVLVYDHPLTKEEIGKRSKTLRAHSLDGLARNTVHDFKVWPYKDSTCGWDGPAAHTSLATSNIEALSPTSFSDTLVDTTFVKLAWDDIASSETAYHVQRCDNPAASCADGDFANIQGDGLVAADVTTYSDSTACNGITYTYRVRAEKDDGPVWNSLWAEYQVTTAAAQTPTLSATVLSESEITLSWSDPNPDEGEFFLARCEGGALSCTTDNDFNDYTMTTTGSIYGADKLLHYRMDEAGWANGATDVKDISGNENHGQPYGDVTTVDTGLDTGPYDRAGDFQGDNDYIVTPLNIDQSSSTAGVTFEAWVKPTLNSATWKWVVSTENGGSDWGFAVNGGWWYVNTGNTYYNPVTVTFDAWQHIALVYEPGQPIKFYKNGTKYTASASYPIYFDSGDNNVNIGRQANSSNYFTGQIDEVAVYERPLTDAEITAHYQNQIDKFEYADTGLTAGKNYTYRIKTLKDAPLSCNGGWETYTEITAATMAPPAPTNLTATVFSTSIVLNWDDNSGSEDNYQVQRCDTAACDGVAYTQIGGDLAAESKTYTDTTICPGNTYSYRVRAVKNDPGGWETLWDTVADNVVTAPPMPGNLTLNLVSEVQIDLAWDDNTDDETFFRIKRCAGADCLEYTVAADTETYNDIALTPATSYTYAIQADQPAATCGWPTAYTEAAGPITTTPNVPGGLNGAAVNSTSVNMTWAEDPNLASETGFTILRCAGAGCSDYTEVGLTDPNATSFTDNTVCNGVEYSYKIKSVGQGLSNGNDGCWTKRAPISFTNGFAANTAVEVVVSYTSGMQTMFEDIRFYDATAKQELPTYWFRTRTESDTAVVWLMTGDYNNIYLYYGNPDATDSSSTDAAFTEIYDDFEGPVIDTSKWVEIDTASYINQASGILRFTNTSTYWVNAMISAKTFERAAGNEVIFDITTNSSIRKYFVLGWDKDQTTSASPNQTMHGMYFNGVKEYQSRFNIYNNGGAISPSSLRYFAESINYLVKIILKDQGAEYYVKGGTLDDWTLIYENSVHYSGDDLLRISMKEGRVIMNINSVTVKHASAQRGVVVGTHEGNGVDCLGGYNLWASAESDAFTATTADNTATPSDFSVAVVSDTEAQLNWTKNTDDETGFKVERCLDATCLVFATGAGTSYLDTGLIPAETYDYRVKAYKLTDDCEWNSLYTDPPISITTSSGAPSDLTATTLNGFKIELNWTDNSTDEDGFEIEAQAWNGTYANIGTVLPDITTFTDNRGLNPGATYKYRVRAYRDSNKSAYSNVITISTAAWQENDSNCVE